MIPEPKSRDQEKRYHAMIGDIARQFAHCGRLWDTEDMKRLLLDQFRRDCKDDPDLKEEWKKSAPLELAPSIDGAGVVLLGIQSRKLTKKLATAFVEWLFAFGAENGVEWTDPTIIPLEAYAE